MSRRWKFGDSTFHGNAGTGLELVQLLLRHSPLSEVQDSAFAGNAGSGLAVTQFDNSIQLVGAIGVSSRHNGAFGLNVVQNMADASVFVLRDVRASDNGATGVGLVQIDSDMQLALLSNVSSHRNADQRADHRPDRGPAWRGGAGGRPCQRQLGRRDRRNADRPSAACRLSSTAPPPTATAAPGCPSSRSAACLAGRRWRTSVPTTTWEEAGSRWYADRAISSTSAFVGGAIDPPQRRPRAVHRPGPVRQRPGQRPKRGLGRQCRLGHLSSPRSATMTPSSASRRQFGPRQRRVWSRLHPNGIHLGHRLVHERGRHRERSRRHLDDPGALTSSGTAAPREAAKQAYSSSRASSRRRCSGDWGSAAKDPADGVATKDFGNVRVLRPLQQVHQHG
jgi:hypothetical protein